MKHKRPAEAVTWEGVSAMSDMPYHVLDSGKVRCHVCGALLRWVDAIETEIGYACEDHILQEDDEPAGGE